MEKAVPRQTFARMIVNIGAAKSQFSPVIPTSASIWLSVPSRLKKA